MDPEIPIYVCGPTASGKSSLALALATELDGELVNADAFQLYRGLERLSAAPEPAERELRPHHLFGVLDPDETCDAMRYRKLALPVLRDIHDRGRVPIVVGGSGLYLKFLSHGASPVPPGDPRLREQLDRCTLDELVRRLRELDPLEASRTDLRNRRYVTRALEICELSGRPCSELRDRWAEASRELDRSLRGLVIRRPRPELHQRIEARAAAMLDGGAIEEVRRHPHVSGTLGKAIGYREIRALLAGKTSRDECLEQIRSATRRYAKRQETWYRRESWLRPVAWTSVEVPPVAAARQALEERPD